MSNEAGSELVVRESENPGNLMRRGTDVAGVCREIVKNTAQSIQGRQYVRVEGWQSIAAAYGCVASSRDVEAVKGGVRAIGELRRIADGHVIAVAEGFVGEDEPTWFGGIVNGKTLPKRPEYAVRAMAQTRAISRVCRSAFAFVVTLIDKNLSTTPAEEVPADGFNDTAQSSASVQEKQEAVKRRLQYVDAVATPVASPPRPAASGSPVAGFGGGKGKTAPELDDKQLEYYAAASRRSLGDPSKERFHERERAWLATLETEQKRRAVTAPAGAEVTP